MKSSLPVLLVRLGIESGPRRLAWRFRPNGIESLSARPSWAAMRNRKGASMSSLPQAGIRDGLRAGSRGGRGGAWQLIPMRRGAARFGDVWHPMATSADRVALAAPGNSFGAWQLWRRMAML